MDVKFLDGSVLLNRVTTCMTKTGNVRDFDSCQWNVTDFTKSQGSVGEKNLAKEKVV